MAGPGAAPKDPSKRARRNADPIPRTILRFEHAEAPELPADLADNLRVFQWWDTWVGSPQAEHFGSTDWMILLETAYLVAAFYAGKLDVAGELRLRQAKFGATPEDRARLRMFFADADDADSGKGSTDAARAGKYGELRSIDPDATPDADAG